MQKRKDMLAWIIAAAAAIFIVIVLVGVIAQYRDCNAAGGVLVRGLIGYECVSR